MRYEVSLYLFNVLRDIPVRRRGERTRRASGNYLLQVVLVNIFVWQRRRPRPIHTIPHSRGTGALLSFGVYGVPCLTPDLITERLVLGFRDLTFNPRTLVKDRRHR